MIAVHWFRRDLRLEDNTALANALSGDLRVLPIFIFDSKILEELPVDDARVSFIHAQLRRIHDQLQQMDSGLLVLQGDPVKVWSELIAAYAVGKVYVNRDYEPYALERDDAVEELLKKHQIEWDSFKDQVIYEKDEVIKGDGSPYTVFTPYKRKWLERYTSQPPHSNEPLNWSNLYAHTLTIPSLTDIGFKKSSIEVKPYDLSMIPDYANMRDIPSEDATSYLSPHLRFGSVSVRKIFHQLYPANEAFLSELIWREFFMQILYHFPRVVQENFRTKYNGITWRNDQDEFNLWCEGRTGYPLVDAGMRQLNNTGYMHNRVRMVTAGFLCKHLLIDWRWGEAYFAQKLLDYELSSNNGNWQWAAGTGCDAAPYFRVFNPTVQLKKFDPELIYIRRWIPEYDSPEYPQPMVEHKFARERAINHYKTGLKISLSKTTMH